MTQKTCRNCGATKDLREYPYFSTSKAGRKNTCKDCSAKLSILRAELKKSNPPPLPGNCPICGVYTTNWILDHCHFSNQFRGYVCNSCNLGLGRFNDDAAILQKAIEYLQKPPTI